MPKNIKKKLSATTANLSSGSEKVVSKNDVPELWSAILRLIDHAIQLEKDDNDENFLNGQKPFIKKVLEANADADKTFYKILFNAQKVVLADSLKEIYHKFPMASKESVERKKKINKIIAYRELLSPEAVSKGKRLRLHSPLKDRNDPEDINFNFRGAMVNAYDRLGDTFKNFSKTTMINFKKKYLQNYEKAPVEGFDLAEIQRERIKNILIYVCKLTPERADALASELILKCDFDDVDPLKPFKDIFARLNFDAALKAEELEPKLLPQDFEK
jgi:hypothetical protein